MDLIKLTRFTFLCNIWVGKVLVTVALGLPLSMAGHIDAELGRGLRPSGAAFTEQIQTLTRSEHRQNLGNASFRREYWGSQSNGHNLQELRHDP